MTRPTRTWCPTCHDDTTGEVCVWCDTPTTTRRGGGKPAGVYGYLTDPQLRAAHMLYQQGLSVRRVAETIHPRTRYRTVASCAEALHQGWRRLALPTRDRREASIAAHTRHGRARRGHRDPAYARELRIRRGETLGIPCAATTNAGTPCRRPALRGERYCHNHHPARRTQVLEQLARARTRQQEAA